MDVFCGFAKSGGPLTRRFPLGLHPQTGYTPQRARARACVAMVSQLQRVKVAVIRDQFHICNHLVASPFGARLGKCENCLSPLCRGHDGIEANNYSCRVSGIDGPTR